MGLQCNCSQHWRPLFWLENAGLCSLVAFCFYARSRGPFVQCKDPGACRPSLLPSGHRTVTVNLFLPLLSPQGQGILCSPIPATSSLWSLDLLLFWKKSFPPLCLIAIKGTLQSLFNSFGILQKPRWALVLEQLLLSILLSLQVSFVSSLLLFQKSFENSHLWVTCPSHSLCSYGFFFFPSCNSTFDFNGVSGGTRSKLGTYSTNKNFYLLKWFLCSTKDLQAGFFVGSFICMYSMPKIYIHKLNIRKFNHLIRYKGRSVCRKSEKCKTFDYIFFFRYNLQIISSFHACYLILFFPFKHTKYWLKLSEH